MNTENTDGLFVVFEGDYHDGRKPTGELFIDKVPETTDRLSAARKRYEAAQHAYDEAVRIDEECDGFGIVPRRVKDELGNAEVELRTAEMERLYPAQ